MNLQQVYQWMNEIARQMPQLGKWQAKGLALFSLGVVWSEDSALTKVAEKLGNWGSADSLERRFQQWISNPWIDTTLCLKWWVCWVDVQSQSLVVQFPTSKRSGYGTDTPRERHHDRGNPSRNPE